MGLYLAESALPKNLREKGTLENAVAALADTATALESTLVEIQVSNDFTRAFLVLESPAQSTVRDILSRHGVPATLIKAVRLVGAELTQIGDSRAKVRYLVEWNLPEGLTMDAYLNRKKTNSVHYAEVPQVTFQRTYVCEDLTKCICFYDSPDEEAVYEARKAVSAPVDAITETFAIPPRK